MGPKKRIYKSDLDSDSVRFHTDLPKKNKSEDQTVRKDVSSSTNQEISLHQPCNGEDNIEKEASSGPDATSVPAVKYIEEETPTLPTETEVTSVEDIEEETSSLPDREDEAVPDLGASDDELDIDHTAQISESASENPECFSDDENLVTVDSDSEETPDGDSRHESLFSKLMSAFDINIPGTSTSLGEMLLRIQDFSTRNSISKEGLSDLIRIIGPLCGGVFPASAYKFYSYFDDFVNLVKVHHVCKNCSRVVLTRNFCEKAVQITCSICETTFNPQKDSETNVLFTLPIQEQIETLLKSASCAKQVAENLAKRNSRERTELSDICDGKVMIDLMKREDFNPSMDLTYCLSTDGASLRKSSNLSVWPVTMIVNEVPPVARFGKRIMAGLWISDKTPDLNVVLSVVGRDLRKLGKESLIKWSHGSNHRYQSKLFATAGLFDAPARAKAMNMKSCNGYSSCNICDQEGEHVQGGGVRFPYDPRVKIRTNYGLQNDMFEAGKKCNVVNGVKGPSSLMILPGFQIARGVPIDFMHNVALGNVKALISFMVDVRAQKFSLSDSQIQEIDRRLKAANVTRDFHRYPRELSAFKKWKASEFLNFLYFFFVVLTNVADAELIEHFSILSEAIFLLSKETVTRNDIGRASSLLVRYVRKHQEMFGKASMVSNVHGLLHLGLCVENHGPLWTHSLFPFEAENGRLGTFIKGTRHDAMQITKKFMRSVARDAVFNSHDMDMASGPKKQLVDFEGLGCSVPYFDGMDYDSYERCTIRGVVFTNEEYGSRRQNRTMDYCVELPGNRFGFVKRILEGSDLDGGSKHVLCIKLLRIFSTHGGHIHKMHVTTEEITVSAFHVKKALMFRVEGHIYVTAQPNVYFSTL